MNWEELKAFLEEEKAKQSQEYKTFINEIADETITDDFLKTNEKITRYVKSQQDSHFDKGLETWKSNNLEKLIQGEIMKRNPAKTPQEIEMEKLRAEMDSIKADKAKAENLARFKDDLVKKNIPLELAPLLISEDPDVTKANLEVFEGSLGSYVEGKLSEKLGTRTDKKEQTTEDKGEVKPLKLSELAEKTRLIKN